MKIVVVEDEVRIREGIIKLIENTKPPAMLGRIE